MLIVALDVFTFDEMKSIVESTKDEALGLVNNRNTRKLLIQFAEDN